QAVATVERLWTALGAEPVRMTAQLHDRVFGAGSHLPHVAAYSLAAALGQLAPDVIDGLRRLPTSSLRDTTRVAASSPAMWRDIFLDNRSEVLPLIEALASCVQELRAAVAAGEADRNEKLLVAGKAGRDREERRRRFGYDVFTEAERMIVAGAEANAGPDTLTVARVRFDGARAGGAFLAATPGATATAWRGSALWEGGGRALALVTPRT